MLSITAAAEHTRGPAPHGLIRLTRNEISPPFATLIIQPVRDAWHHLRWSAWQRRHQHRAKPATTSDKPGNHEDPRSPAGRLTAAPGKGIDPQ